MRPTRQVLAGLLISLLSLIAVGSPLEQAPSAVESVDDESPRLRVLGKLVMEEVARDVSTGRRSLAEAAALFGELGRLELPATDLARVRPYDSLPTHEERLCRQVIIWVNSEMSDAGLPAGPVVARLDAEVRRLRERGPIHLPDMANREPIEDLLRHARARFAAENQWRRTGAGQSPAIH